MKEELKGKCTNCGKPMKEESNENWQVYCTDKACREVFMKQVLDMKINGIKTPYNADR